MKTKKCFWTELAYVAGLALLALGTALMERANFGLSMVVAPAYLLHLKIAPFFPAFTFGMAEYVLQAALLAVLALIMRRFKPVYLFSFVTAVLYGFMLDACMALIGLLPVPDMLGRTACYLSGMLLCALGVSLLFHTYIPPEAYELFVKELSAKTGANIHAVKTVYDCCSCLVGILLSFVFFGMGHFEGVKRGTIVCALCNGYLIGRCSRFLDAAFEFRDRLNLRARFER